MLCCVVLCYSSASVQCTRLSVLTDLVSAGLQEHAAAAAEVPDALCHPAHKGTLHHTRDLHTNRQHAADSRTYGFGTLALQGEQGKVCDKEGGGEVSKGKAGP